MKTSNKTQLYLVSACGGSHNGETVTRLIRGTMREVESKLRGEWEVRVASAEECHAMHATPIEDATGEPV